MLRSGFTPRQIGILLTVMSIVLLAVVVLMLARLGGELWLELLNRREVLRTAKQPPAAVTAIMDAATFKKAGDYTLAHQRFDMVETVFDTAVLGLVLFGGILPVLFGDMAAWAPGAARPPSSKPPESVWLRMACQDRNPAPALPRKP